MSGRVIVAGVGPGNPQWLTGRLRELLQKADVLSGFRSAVAVVEAFLDSKQQAGPQEDIASQKTRPDAQIKEMERLVLDYRNQEDGLAKVASRAREGKLCLICCYGDPNFSDTEFLARITRHWPDVEVVPGISSVQLACAKARIAMESSLFITLHVREGYQEALEELLALVSSPGNRRHAIVLPRPWDYMPPAIARQILERGAQLETKVAIYERLSLEDEKSHSFSLGELAQSSYEFSDLSIMVIFAPDTDA